MKKKYDFSKATKTPYIQGLKKPDRTRTEIKDSFGILKVNKTVTLEQIEEATKQWPWKSDVE